MSSCIIHTMRQAALGLLLALILTGCASSPPEHFYTLSGNTGVARMGMPASTPLYIEVTTVSIPPQVRRTQFVVRTSGGGVDILEQQRWAGPLSGEIGQALSLGITARLGAVDVYHTPYPDKVVVYRVSTNVQRFESAPGEYALLDAVWSVQERSRGTILTCRTVVHEPVGPGYEALVEGHRIAVDQLALAMASVITSMTTGVTGSCPAL